MLTVRIRGMWHVAAKAVWCYDSPIFPHPMSGSNPAAQDDQVTPEQLAALTGPPGPERAADGARNAKGVGELFKALGAAVPEPGASRPTTRESPEKKAGPGTVGGPEKAGLETKPVDDGTVKEPERREAPPTRIDT